MTPFVFSRQMYLSTKSVVGMCLGEGWKRTDYQKVPKYTLYPQPLLQILEDHDHIAISTTYPVTANTCTRHPKIHRQNVVSSPTTQAPRSRGKQLTSIHPSTHNDTPSRPAAHPTVPRNRKDPTPQASSCTTCARRTAPLSRAGWRRGRRKSAHQGLGQAWRRRWRRPMTGADVSRTRHIRSKSSSRRDGTKVWWRETIPETRQPPPLVVRKRRVVMCCSRGSSTLLPDGTRMGE
ncbi:hypothetical protein QBC39DRAFT_20032 [Podospora conica]|nr:hypothetical protein QBC39DRAFT_20032 [Schizothecium conicum]